MVCTPGSSPLRLTEPLRLQFNTIKVYYMTRMPIECHAGFIHGDLQLERRAATPIFMESFSFCRGLLGRIRCAVCSLYEARYTASSLVVRFLPSSPKVSDIPTQWNVNNEGAVPRYSMGYRVGVGLWAAPDCNLPPRDDGNISRYTLLTRVARGFTLNWQQALSIYLRRYDERQYKNTSNARAYFISYSS
jgi:hypothetical protein